ncbi:MAG: ABC transporter permease [Planctomycetia bacterium]|nr:ABC transporter permease [Planctomycetia bacterium]
MTASQPNLVLFAFSWQLPLSLAVPLGTAGAVVALLVIVGKIPLSYNVRNLVVRWRTTLLTALAFTLVISLQTVMLGFVNGMYQLTDESGQPGNVIVLSDGAVDELVSNLGFSDLNDIDHHPGVLRDEREQPLASREVYLVVNQPLSAAPGQQQRRRFTQVRGIEDPLLATRVHGLELYPGGTWFSEAGVQAVPGAWGDEQQQAIQAVLGEGVAGQMGQDRGKPQLEVGDLFELGPRKWVVVGIMRSAGSTFGSEIWSKRALVGPMFGKGAYSSIVLRTQDAKTAQQVSDDLTKNFKKAALQAQPETVYFSKLSETNRQFSTAIVFVAIVMAVGGVFGVMNTMFAAISGRTKDIGLLRVIGFARWQILISFFLESLTISLAGGLLGCALGFLANGWTATSIVSGGQGGGGKFVVLELVIGADTLFAGLLLALAMGAIGGLLPAISAMRLKPLESLR